MMKPFTIIVPVYNEEEVLKANIEKLVAYSASLQTPYEIIIVSNGSTDASDRIGRGLESVFPQVKYLSLPQKGVGRAFKAGLKAARYDHIIFLDADLSADLAFVAKADRQLADHVLVLGTKINGLQNRSLFRRLGSLVFYLSVLCLMGLRYADYAPGAKAYQKAFLARNLQYIDDFTSFVLNLTFIAHIKKEPIAEIPITCDDRRRSRFNLWHEALRKYYGLFRLKFKQVFGQI